MRLLGLALMIGLLIAKPETGLSQPSCGGINLKILNIRNATGTIGCALFDSQAGFPREYLRFASRVMVTKIADTQVRCDFEYIPQGNYAIAVMHDENMNGKHDTNKLGVPTEGSGFSNNPKAFGAPSFSSASFFYNGMNLDLTIILQY